MSVQRSEQKHMPSKWISTSALILSTILAGEGVVNAGSVARQTAMEHTQKAPKHVSDYDSLGDEEPNKDIEPDKKTSEKDHHDEEKHDDSLEKKHAEVEANAQNLSDLLSKAVASTIQDQDQSTSNHELQKALTGNAGSLLSRLMNNNIDQGKKLMTMNDVKPQELSNNEKETSNVITNDIAKKTGNQELANALKPSVQNIVHNSPNKLLLDKNGQPILDNPVQVGGKDKSITDKTDNVQLKPTASVDKTDVPVKETHPAVVKPVVNKPNVPAGMIPAGTVNKVPVVHPVSPAGGRPQQSVPVVSHPVVEKPVVNKPVVNKPVVNKPVETQPSVQPQPGQSDVHVSSQAHQVDLSSAATQVNSMANVVNSQASHVNSMANQIIQNKNTQVVSQNVSITINSNPSGTKVTYTSNAQTVAKPNMITKPSVPNISNTGQSPTTGVAINK